MPYWKNILQCQALYKGEIELKAGFACRQGIQGLMLVPDSCSEKNSYITAGKTIDTNMK